MDEKLKTIIDESKSIVFLAVQEFPQKAISLTSVPKKACITRSRNTGVPRRKCCPIHSSCSI